MSAKKKNVGITNSEILDSFNPDFNETEEAKGKSILSPERKLIEKEQPSNAGLNDLEYLMEKTLDKSSKAIYIDKEGHRNLQKLSFVLDVDIRQLNTNIVNMFFSQNQESLMKLMESKMKF